MMATKGKHAPSASPPPPTPQSTGDPGQIAASTSSSSSGSRQAALAATGVGLHPPPRHGGTSSASQGGTGGAHASPLAVGLSRGASTGDGDAGGTRPLHRKTYIGVTYVERLKKYRSCFFSPIESKTIGTGTWPSPYEAARARHEKVAELPPEMRVRVSDDFEYDEVDKDRPKPAELQGEDLERMAARARARASARDTKTASRGMSHQAGASQLSSGGEGKRPPHAAAASHSKSAGRTGIVMRQQPSSYGPLLPLSGESDAAPTRVHVGTGGLPGAGAQAAAGFGSGSGEIAVQAVPEKGQLATPARHSHAHVAHLGVGGRAVLPGLIPHAGGGMGMGMGLGEQHLSIFDIPTPTHGHGPGGGPRIGQPPPRPVKKPRTGSSMAATGAQAPPFRVWPGSATPNPSAVSYRKTGADVQERQEASPADSSPVFSATGRSYGTSVMQAAGALDLIAHAGQHGGTHLPLPQPAHAALAAGPSAWSRSLAQQPKVILTPSRPQVKRGRDDAAAVSHGGATHDQSRGAGNQAAHPGVYTEEEQQGQGAAKRVFRDSPGSERVSAPVRYNSAARAPASQPSHLALAVPPVGPVVHPSTAHHSPRPGLNGLLPVHTSMHQSTLYGIGPGPLTELLQGGHMWTGTPRGTTQSPQRPPQGAIAVHQYGPYFPPMTLPSPQGAPSYPQAMGSYPLPIPGPAHSGSVMHPPYGPGPGAGAGGQYRSVQGARVGAGGYDGSSHGIEMPAGGVGMPTVSGPLHTPQSTHYPGLDLPSMADVMRMPGAEATGEADGVGLPVPVPSSSDTILRGMHGPQAVRWGGRASAPGLEQSGPQAQAEANGPKPMLMQEGRAQSATAALSSGSSMPRNDSFILPQR